MMFFSIYFLIFIYYSYHYYLDGPVISASTSQFWVRFQLRVVSTIATGQMPRSNLNYRKCARVKVVIVHEN